MYNLLVSGNEEAWESDEYTLDISRYLEYTEKALTEEYRELNKENFKKLSMLPCLFAYESGCNKPARIGRLISFKMHGRKIAIQFQIHRDGPLINPADIIDFAWDLGIADYELYRTHWALKDEDLHAALGKAGYTNIEAAKEKTPVIDISKQIFDVALTFPGDVRGYVKNIADLLTSVLGKDKVFYDNYYKAQLARPNLDLVLQDLYKNRAKLVVVFLCETYGARTWCGIEFRAIRQIISDKKDDMIMFVKFDDGKVEGVFPNDGYVDANDHTPAEIADMILERHELQSIRT